MTTAALESRPASGAVNRITRVVRLNLANPWTTVIMPWIVIASIFALSYGIWLIIYASAGPDAQANASEGMQWSGASSWIFFYMLVVAAQAMNFTFPLALGFGSTRRDFYLGSALTFVLLSAAYSLPLTALAEIEEATDGWGVHGTMFTAVYFGGGDVEIWQRAVIFFCVMLFFFFIGAAISTIYVRWKATGLTLTLILLGLAVVGVIALITVTNNWPAVGEFFVTYQPIGVALWLLVPTALAGLAGYLVLRRARPR